MSSTQPPEDPEYTSEPKALSPVSPKPLHYPIPDKIPVLQKQIDPVFNQMDTHMNGHGGDETSEQMSAPQQQPEVDHTSGATQADPAGAEESLHADSTMSGNTAPSHAVPASNASTLPDPSTSTEAPAAQTAPSTAVPDYTALLNSIALPTSFSQLDHTASFIPLDDSAATSNHFSSATSAGLPPRPPPAEAQHNAHAIPGQAAPGAAYTTNPSGLPPPPMASFQQSATSAQPTPMSPSQASFGGRQRDGRRNTAGIDPLAEEDETPWSNETKNLYDAFLESERDYVTIGDWEQFPYGSRLFVGNLSSERVTKRDVFHAFHKYGKLAQISIKQAYGFVQFLNSADCARAMDGEQGRIIRGKRINLEISKPQKNRPGAGGGGGGGGRRRSRSAGRRDGSDRYAPGGSRQGDAPRRGRDDYRPGRSPSPRGGYRDRSRDRHGRFRSRSRSPRGRGGRYRSPSPRRDEGDDLPLPRRAPRDVPDVQIIVAEELDRNFVQWVEGGIRSRGVKVDVLLLSPRLSEAAVIKRQIVEGVVAVSRLTRINQQSGKIPLQVFDRRGGSDVRFEEYADLDPNIAAEVVLRARANNQPSYGYGYGNGATGPAAASPQQASFPPSALAPQLGSAISSMDASGLQKLLGAIQQPNQQAGGLTSDLAKLLGGAAPPGGGGAQSMHDPLAALRSNPALAGLLSAQQGVSPGQQQQQAGQQSGGQPNMADILAKLGSYRR